MTLQSNNNLFDLQQQEWQEPKKKKKKNPYEIKIFPKAEDM